MKPAFAELCAKTNFSLLEGASRPEEMIEAALELGLFAIAVADRNGFYGSVRAHEAAKKVSQKYIVAAEIPVGRRNPAAHPTDSSSKVVFLVENQVGYRNLCRLLTSAHADRPREEALLSFSLLAGACEGLFAILRVPREPVEDGADVAEALRDHAQGRAFVA